MEDEYPTKSGIPASSSPEDSVEINEIVTELGEEARWKQEIIQSLLEPCDRITYGQRQREAAQKLGVSVRTVRRLVKKWEEKGLEALTQTTRTDKGKHRINQEWQEFIIVDKIYRTRDNRAWCKERGIRISGPPLGRPPVNLSEATKKQALDDEKIRNSIEGKFGQGKRRFSLNRIMNKLAHTSETAIAITFLVMNLSVILRQILGSIFLLNYFFRVIDYDKLSVNSLLQKKLIYPSNFIR